MEVKAEPPVNPTPVKNENQNQPKPQRENMNNMNKNQNNQQNAGGPNQRRMKNFQQNNNNNRGGRNNEGGRGGYMGGRGPMKNEVFKFFEFSLLACLNPPFLKIKTTVNDVTIFSLRNFFVNLNNFVK